MPIKADRATRRIAISVEYDGSGYRGWQAQKHDTQVVQSQVEKALSKIADERVRVICSGRTDSGVHASSQICHFDTQADRDPYNWVMGVNTQLPNDVSLSWAKEVDASFHARFSALSRQYVYLIRLSGIRSALLSNAVTFTHKELDAQLMAQAGRWLVGTHDFNAYRSTQCQAKTSVRTLMQLNVYQHNDVIAVHVEANGFLQNMVRNIVGVLIAIGSREASVNWSRDVLDSKDRTQGGLTAAPNGLYFLGPTYSLEVDLPETVRIPQIAGDILRTDPLQYPL
jgi:tRNA pseudouridine38-40 synthase